MLLGIICSTHALCVQASKFVNNTLQQQKFENIYYIDQNE